MVLLQHPPRSAAAEPASHPVIGGVRRVVGDGSAQVASAGGPVPGGLGRRGAGGGPERRAAPAPAPLQRAVRLLLPHPERVGLLRGRARRGHRRAPPAERRPGALPGGRHRRLGRLRRVQAPAVRGRAAPGERRRGRQPADRAAERGPGEPAAVRGPVDGRRAERGRAAAAGRARRRDRLLAGVRVRRSAARPLHPGRALRRAARRPAALAQPELPVARPRGVRRAPADLPGHFPAAVAVRHVAAHAGADHPAADVDPAAAGHAAQPVHPVRRGPGGHHRRPGGRGGLLQRAPDRCGAQVLPEAAPSGVPERQRGLGCAAAGRRRRGKVRVGGHRR